MHLEGGRPAASIVPKSVLAGPAGTNPVLVSPLWNAATEGCQRMTSKTFFWMPLE